MLKARIKSKYKDSQNKITNILSSKIFTVLAFIALSCSAYPVSALDISDAELDAAINQTNQKLLDLQSKELTLETQLEIFDAQIELAQQQLNSTVATLQATEQKINDINEQIKLQEAILEKKQDEMAVYLKTIYMDGQTSYMELIATSNSLSEFVSKSEYLNAMTENIQEAMDQINTIKADLKAKALELDTEKANILQLKTSQELQLNAISSQKYAKDLMLEQTKGESSNLNEYLNVLYAERRRRSDSNGETSGGGTDAGYPYTNTTVYNQNGRWFCSPDTWRMCARQCTSYAAYKATSLGIIPANTIRSWAGQADGGNWYWLAAASGLTVTKTPRANSIVSFPQQAGMPYGHVAYVNSVNPDGTINLSEYNYLDKDDFGTRDNVNPVTYDGYFIY